MSIRSEETHSSLAGARGPVGSRGNLVASLEKLLCLTTGLLADGARRDLRAACARVREDRFNLVVLGEFKRGKSTLINALLGRELLPTGVVPLTSVVTAIGAGAQDRLVVHYVDGRKLERAVDQLIEYVTETGNPSNRLGVELVRIELDHELLRAGVELVDTPGIGSIHSHNTQVTHDFLPQVDAAVCVLDASQPLSEAERQLFIDARRRIPRLLLVINKIDHLDEPDREEAVRFVRSGLCDLLGSTDVDLYVVSALKRDGLAPLRARLLALAADDRDSLLVRSAAGLGRGVALEAARAARFEAQALRLPLDELASRARHFERRVSELRAAGAEAGDLLERGTERALQRVVNEPLQDHARRADAHLRSALRERAAELGHCSPRDLSEELEYWIDETVRDGFAVLAQRTEIAIAHELTELERRYAARVTTILEEGEAIAEDVFGVRASDVLPQTGLRGPSRFSFKLHDVENALDMIVGLGRTIAPGRWGRKLVIRDAEQRLADMTDRHAGRLRSELADRVKEAARSYRSDLTVTVHEAADAIRGAVDRATERRQFGEQRADGRLHELAQIERECEHIARTMDRWALERQPPDETELR